MSKRQNQNNNRDRNRDPLQQNFNYMKFSTYVPLTQYYPAIDQKHQNQQKVTNNNNPPQNTFQKQQQSQLKSYIQNQHRQARQLQAQKQKTSKSYSKTNTETEPQSSFSNYFEMRQHSINKSVHDLQSERIRKQEEQKLKAKQEQWVERQNKKIRQTIIINQQLQMMELRRKKQLQKMEEQKKLQEQIKLDEQKLERVLREKHEKLQRQGQHQKRGQLQQFLAHERQRTVDQPTVVIIQPQQNNTQIKIQQSVVVVPEFKSQTKVIPKIQQLPQQQLKPQPIIIQQTSIRSNIHTLGTWLLLVRDYYRDTKASIRQSQSYSQLTKNCETFDKQIIEPISSFYSQIPSALTQLKCQLISGHSLQSRVLFTGALSIAVGAVTLSCYRRRLIYSLYPLVRNTLISYAFIGYFITPEVYFPLVQNKWASTVFKNNTQSTQSYQK